ncbi:hypothetical protein ELI41_32760 (plasmid) [Rhizobium leguminosarum]|nr:hypothetical protein ELI40_29020 [Rhizobium leguminosarum]TAU79291.1 hypothetical protein ELI41_32760 [Rhizobium leguminosarum]TAV40748.1 hypothetical protein ELI29_35970 [Rhizobium leguminosarum]TAX02945.1 hypothetical protein ELI07_32320 [Rhizobium leguminosarum]TAY05355.1 hypothetical protein ELH96_31860 [Rhizobium leguminosarum]
MDRERLGVIGVCGWGGMALNAVAVDKRTARIAKSRHIPPTLGCASSPSSKLRSTVANRT